MSKSHCMFTFPVLGCLPVPRLESPGSRPWTIWQTCQDSLPVDQSLPQKIRSWPPVNFTGQWILKFMQLLSVRVAKVLQAWTVNLNLARCSCRVLRPPRVVERGRRGDISVCGWQQHCRACTEPKKRPPKSPKMVYQSLPFCFIWFTRKMLTRHLCPLKQGVTKLSDFGGGRLWQVGAENVLMSVGANKALSVVLGKE